MPDFSFTPPPSLTTEEQHIADFIATRMEMAATAREEGRDADCEALLQSALEVATEADDQVSLGFLYLVLDRSQLSS